jgi:hypothetical protein
VTKDQIVARLTSLLYEGYDSFTVAYGNDIHSTLYSHPTIVDVVEQAQYLYRILEFCLENEAYFGKTPERTVVSIFPRVF